MSKMIQLRHVPDTLHRTLKARAALEGMSLSEYLVREVRKVAEHPTAAEIWERVGRRPASDLTTAPAAAVRRERDAR